MKPIKLVFQGINSFSDRTEIDFERLLDDGLFGIFGKTGSGKSTILDCILYALFSKTSRSQTIREYVNNKSNSAFVDFTFEMLTDGERCVYNVKRTIKINKRNQTDTTVSFSKKIGGDFYPVDDGDVNSKIKEVIGIGYDEFSKCIILPQNEFSAFVKSTRAVRLGLVCKLFGLEKYDQLLTWALKKRITVLERDLSGILGELKQYDDFTEEYLAEKRTLLCSASGELEELSARIKELEGLLEKESKLYAVKVSYNDNERLISRLENEKALVDRYRVLLEKKDAANDVCDAYRKLEEVRNTYKKTSDVIAMLSDELGSVQTKLDGVMKEKEQDRSGKLIEVNGLALTLKANATVIDQIECLRREYAQSKAEMSRLTEEKARITCDLGGLLQKLDELPESTELVDSLFAKAGAGAISAELMAQISYFKEKLVAIESYKKDALYEAVRAEINSKLQEIDGRLIALPKELADPDSLSAQIDAIRENNRQRMQIADRISSLKSALVSVGEKISGLENSMEKLLSEGEQKRQILVLLSEQIGERVVDRVCFERVLKRLESDIKKLSLEIESLDKKEKELLSRRADLLIELSSLKERLSLLSDKERDFLESFEKAMSLSPFDSKDEAASFALDESEALRYNNKVKSFDEQYASAKALRENLKQQLDGSCFNEEKYIFTKSQREDLVNKTNEITANVKVLEREVENALAKLKEAEEVNRRKNKVSEDLELCDKLEKVLANRNLLNFIAEEYLSDICINAAQTLLMLTSGRYDLVYDGEFFVTDNLNCGDRRPVSTLSGGETFLVSLSLALALSQAICEKSNRPAEFFFLDEGFGSLDADLTETVIDSLEKLRSAHFAIGVISHVPELKQRIASKILVSPATATGGSKIEVVV